MPDITLPVAILTQNTITVPVQEYDDPEISASFPIALEETLAVTLVIPIVTIAYSEPGQFAPLLMLENHLPVNSFSPPEETLVVALETPAFQIDTTFSPPEETLVLAVLTPTLIIDSQVFPLAFNLIGAGPNEISPTHGILTTQIRKFINDPVVTGGCAQCGTLLWDSHENAIPIESERVFGGLNFDRNNGQPFQPGAGGGGGPDDRYVRCARCGWINNMDIASSQPEGSRSGWGISFPEFEVIPNEPADDWGTQRLPSQPGTIDNSTP